VVNTFPNVTIAAGAEADLSYAGTVVGSEQINTRDAWTTPIELPFFDDDFVDGTDPTTSPGPCYIDSFYGTPGCPSTWPSNWEPQLGWTHYNLDSQQYAWPVRTAVTWANLNCGGTQSNPTACSISNPGTNSLHCAYQNGVYACAYPLLLACSNVTPATALYVPSDPDESPGVVWFANPNNLYYSLDYGWLMITSCTQPNGKGTAWSCINPPPAAADGSTGIVASITMEPISTCTPYPTSGT